MKPTLFLLVSLVAASAVQAQTVTIAGRTFPLTQETPNSLVYRSGNTHIVVEVGPVVGYDFVRVPTNNPDDLPGERFINVARPILPATGRHLCVTMTVGFRQAIWPARDFAGGPVNFGMSQAGWTGFLPDIRATARYNP